MDIDLSKSPERPHDESRSSNLPEDYKTDLPPSASPGRLHSDANSTPGKRSQRRVISWDEAVIAEHDKERGTRQKIDEPPTPFRYSSESDQSEGESSVSSTENSAHKKKKSVSLGGVFKFQHPMDGFYGEHFVPLPPTISSTAHSTGVMNEWSTLQAKLAYEQHLQEQAVDSHILVDRMVLADDEDVDRSPLPGNRKIHGAVANDSTCGNQMQIDEGVQVSKPGDDENGSAEEADSPETKEQHSKDFASRRAAHYNEYLVLMAARKKLAEEEDDDDDEEDEVDEVDEEDDDKDS